jgi:IS605 OrfB family transposase
MKLVEKHIINRSHKDWRQIDSFSFISKNLYNEALYFIKNEFQKTGKYPRYKEVENYFRKSDNVNYVTLPNNTSQQILMLLDRNIKSFFALLKKWKKDKKSLSGSPQFLKYKDKTKGRNILIFTYNQFVIKKGYLHFPKKMKINPIKIQNDNIVQVRIVPQSSCYKIECIYEKQEEDLKLNNDNYISIDLGINNLCAITTNQSGLKPLLINGKPLKSFNSYFNKLLAKEKSQLKKNHNKNISNKIKEMYNYRQNFINHYLHNVSKTIIDYCVKNDIGNIIIGKNKNWKQEANLGKKNNQNFMNIPHDKLINMISYKAKMKSINIILNEESYTSKCDALSKEEIKKHDTYLGKRIKRGLFQSSINKSINADTNGSLNIMRKVIGDSFITKINIGHVVCPLKVNPLLKKCI